MIVRLQGRLTEKHENSIVLDVQGIHYEVFIPISVAHRLEQTADKNGCVSLITYHYLQMDPSRAFPVLVGFSNEIEKDFFEQFITVSGIGPRAAIRAINKPISEIASAIDRGDIDFLKTLPGIGMQRAKEIIAKLQGKVGKFGLIQDRPAAAAVNKDVPDWQQEALEILLQLQYKKQEASDMINKALERAKGIQTTEELLNEIYKQRTKR